jgi:hypothetical protein
MRAMFSSTILCCGLIMATASVTSLVHAAADHPIPGHEAAAGHSTPGHAEMSSEGQAQASPMPVPPPAPQSPIGDRWGIQADSVRLSGHGHIVIFRYRVIDSTKALSVINPQTKPRIIDQESGSQLSYVLRRFLQQWSRAQRKQSHRRLGRSQDRKPSRELVRGTGAAPRRIRDWNVAAGTVRRPRASGGDRACT